MPEWGDLVRAATGIMRTGRKRVRSNRRLSFTRDIGVKSRESGRFYSGKGTNLSTQEAGSPSAGLPLMVESLLAKSGPAGRLRLVAPGPSARSEWTPS